MIKIPKGIPTCTVRELKELISEKEDGTNDMTSVALRTAANALTLAGVPDDEEVPILFTEVQG